MTEARFIASGTLARFALAQPDSTPLTFTLTLTSAEWHGLLRQLPADGCSQTLGAMISTMLGELTGRMHATYTTTGWSGAKPVEGEETR